MALETKLCHVLGFADHLQSNIGMPFVLKATQQQASSQGVAWMFHTPYHPQGLSAKCWDGLLQVCSTSVTLSSPHTLTGQPGHCHHQGCGHPLKALISSQSAIS